MTKGPRIADARDDACDEPIRVVVRIQLVRFNNKLVNTHRDFTSKLT